MKRVVIICFTFCLVSCFNAEPVKKISVESNFNIEALVICFEIADKGFWDFPFNNFQPMKTKARDRFRAYKNHKAIQLIDSLVNKGLWLDGMVEIMLKSAPLPDGKLIHSLDAATLKRLSTNAKEAESLAEDLIAAISTFYIDTNMADYFEENAIYFNAVNQEVRNNLPDTYFINAMENYYGKKNESYTLIPSPSLYHTMGFGKRIESAIGYKVFNVFGPLKATKDSVAFGFGFNDINKIDVLTVHEFGHSFINPILDLSKNAAIIDTYEHLFDTIKAPMQSQGYGSWRSCVAEHLVRLGEIRISYALGDPARADSLRTDYINNRSFIYLSELEKEIQEYEETPYLYKSIDEFIPKLLNSFSRMNSKVKNKNNHNQNNFKS